MLLSSQFQMDQAPFPSHFRLYLLSLVPSLPLDYRFPLSSAISNQMFQIVAIMSKICLMGGILFAGASRDTMVKDFLALNRAYSDRPDIGLPQGVPNARQAENREIMSHVDEVSYILAERLSGTLKPFTTGKLVKQCLLDAAEKLCTEKVPIFQKLQVSAKSIARKTLELGEDLKEQLKEKIPSYQKISIALDESGDTGDIAQMIVYLKGVDANLQVHMNPLDLIPLYDTTTGDDIFKAICDLFDRFEIPWDKLVSITTDGAPALKGTIKVFIHVVL